MVLSSDAFLWWREADLLGDMILLVVRSTSTEGDVSGTSVGSRAIIVDVKSRWLVVAAATGGYMRAL